MAMRELVKLIVTNGARDLGLPVTEEQLEAMTDAMMKNPDVQAKILDLEQNRRDIDAEDTTEVTGGGETGA